MNRIPHALDLVQIASPCKASWEHMTGDDRVRYCGQCRLHVYNLSELTRAEAERLIQSREGRTCVRMFRRADGTVLTRDCPVGLRGARQRLIRAVAAVAGLLVAILTGTLFAGRQSSTRPNSFRCESPVFARWIQPEPDVHLLMGDVALPLPTPPECTTTPSPPAAP